MRPTRVRSLVGVPTRTANLIACLLVNVHSVDLRRNPPSFAEHSLGIDVLILVLSAALHTNSLRFRPPRFPTVDTFQDKARTTCRRVSAQLAEKAGQYAEPYRIRRKFAVKREANPGGT